MSIRAALDKAGVKYTWEGVTGRPYEFSPSGLMWHHTASRAGSNALNVVKNGTGSLPGPLSQLFIARDGKIHVVSEGHCNHAGTGWDGALARVRNEETPRRPQGAGNMSGNRYFIGVEIDNNGIGETYSIAQMAACISVGAAIHDYYDWGVNRSIAHAEWSGRKIDPSFGVAEGGNGFKFAGQMNPAMAEFRDAIADMIELGKAPAAPEPEPVKKAMTKADWDAIAELVEADKAKVAAAAEAERLERRQATNVARGLGGGLPVMITDNAGPAVYLLDGAGTTLVTADQVVVLTYLGVNGPIVLDPEQLAEMRSA